MKVKPIRVLSVLIAMFLITTSISIQSPKALENKTISNQAEAVLNEGSKNFHNNIKGKQQTPIEEVIHVKNKETANKVNPKEINFKKSVQAIKSQNKSYTMAELNSLSYSELANVITSLKWNNITDLFQYNEDARKFYSDSNRVQYLINELERKGTQFTKDDSKGIDTLIEVIRAGFYLGFYNDGLNGLGERSYHDKCIPAIKSIQKNPNFRLGTIEQDEVIAAVGLLINNASCNAEIVNNFVPILQQYKNNMSIFIKERSKGVAIHNVINGVQYDINDYVYVTQKPFVDTPWSGKIDNFINFISQVALIKDLNDDNEWLINNCIFYMAKLGKVHSNPKEGSRVLTEAMKLYPYLGEQYLQAAFSIEDDYESKDYYGKIIDVNKIKEAGKTKYLPNKFNFDDGKVIIIAGNNVTEEKIKRVYWASKEVQAQFFRALGSDKALEQGNTDDVLTMVIYNSPKEYQMNRLLNGLDVNNGGMYIENQGTFYTYERTEQESIYTLEELFRHEFTHYLQGRYMVPGMWGTGEIYNNGRLTWFEEGGAELFAGSTRTESILARKSVVSNILRTPENSRYTVNKTMHSQYGSFDFYHYSFVLQNYMYGKDFYKMYDLMQTIKNNDVKKYDELIAKYSSDRDLEKKYQEHMKDLINKYSELTVPLVSDDYLIKHSVKKAEEIYADITTVASLQDVKTTEANSQFLKSFTLRGQYNAGKSEGKVNDIRKMDKILNGNLKTLSEYSWSGYKTVTAYMVNYQLDKDNNVSWELVFNGILTGDGTEIKNLKPVANINGPYKGKTNENIAFTSEKSTDKDGKIVEYLWGFGDETSSKEANPSHKYNKAGNYTVTLKVTDDRGDSDSKETKVTVEEVVVIDPDGKYEVELNDTFDKANRIVDSNSIMNGKLEGRDQDIFYFDVLADSKVDISLINNGDMGINWLVYQANDTNKYIAYPNENNGKELKGSLNAKEGRYYVVVYGYSGGKSEYYLDVKGNIGQIPDKIITEEKEDNNNFENANVIKFNDAIVKANLSQKDVFDVYCFDITTEGTEEIVLSNNSNGKLGAAWMLYSEKDLKKYIAYGTTRSGNKLSAKVDLKPGKYYLYVYSYSGSGDYSIETHFNK